MKEAFKKFIDGIKLCLTHHWQEILVVVLGICMLLSLIGFFALAPNKFWTVIATFGLLGILMLLHTLCQIHSTNKMLRGMLKDQRNDYLRLASAVEETNEKIGVLHYELTTKKSKTKE